MADQKISQLPTDTSPSLTALLPMADNGSTMKATLASAISHGTTTWVTATSASAAGTVYPVNTVIFITDTWSLRRGDGSTPGGISPTPGWDTLTNNFMQSLGLLSDPTGDLFVQANVNPVWVGFGSDMRITLSAGHTPPAGLYYGGGLVPTDIPIINFESMQITDYSKVSMDFIARQGFASDGTTVTLDWNTQSAAPTAANATDLASELGSLPNTKAVIDNLRTRLGQAIACLQAYKLMHA